MYWRYAVFRNALLVRLTGSATTSALFFKATNTVSLSNTSFKKFSSKLRQFLFPQHTRLITRSSAWHNPQTHQTGQSTPGSRSGRSSSHLLARATLPWLRSNHASPILASWSLVNDEMNSCNKRPMIVISFVDGLCLSKHECTIVCWETPIKPAPTKKCISSQM